MKRFLICLPILSSMGFSLGLAGFAEGHDLANGDPHPHYDWSVKPPETVRAPEWFLAQLDSGPAKNQPRSSGGTSPSTRPPQAIPFDAFAPLVKVRWDPRYLFIESNGLPAHGMMVGITNWQQQVPMPQNYTGANAWQIPLFPTPAKTPASIKGRFLRGAIALAVNGIPIFNPQNNRGEISAEIGELDDWGGHCGRADDYHYHAAPLHLQSVVGKGQPIAFALDGYPIYGLTEPDGSAPVGLDAVNGHTTPALGYHYHASKKYPYVNGGFHGEVVEAGGQVDPQPRAQSVRPALPPFRGAKITAFTAAPDERSFALKYTVNGNSASINYAAADEGVWKFQFVNADGSKQEEAYRAGGGRGGPGAGGGEGPPPGGPAPTANRPPQREGASRDQQGRGKNAGFVPSTDQPRSSNGTFMLTSPEVEDLKEMPADYSGDGSGATLPLEWKGAPAGTLGYVLIMDHTDPEGAKKWYWTVYDIPASVTSFPKNVKGIGKVGTGFKGQIGYEPPHSRGPGAKTYVLTIYALSAPLNLTQSPREVNREVLLAAIKGKVLASSSLRVVHTSGGNGGSGNGGGQRP